MRNKIITYCLITAAFLLLYSNAFGNDWERIESLRGYWKFTIGDDIEWADPGYDDSNWEEIRVPTPWESEGFHGYNGYAWYRTDFFFPEKYEGFSLQLHLGYIDDVDEVYLNGKLIGLSGSFPPNYITAYDAYRKYPVPREYLNVNGKNILAVRVFDSQLDGGIVGGKIGIYAYTLGMRLNINLEGEWKFKADDDPEYKDPGFNDENWNSIYVPGFWESFGYKDYNGFGWYRKKVFIPEKYRDRKLVLVLGKIDDVDETFLNGNKVGATGDMYDVPHSISSYDWQQFRGYFLRESDIKFGEDNLIAVRVFDSQINGGIYEGPVGLITQEEYRDYWKNRKEKKNIWDLFFGD